MKIFQKKLFSLYLLALSNLIGIQAFAKAPVVLMTDFGLTDGAVSTMKGVIYTVDQNLIISDVSHNIEAFNIFEASYRLFQVMQYYPKGSVFVSVVDPGVGTQRKSIVAKTKNGYYIVTPDNGTLTHIASEYGIEEIREIDEEKNRLPNSKESFTFYGRDVFAFTGAKLAADKISFEGVGPNIVKNYITFPIIAPEVKKNEIHGKVIILDGDYGNLWTNVTSDFMKKIDIKVGSDFNVEIRNKSKLVYKAKIKYGNTFGDVKEGQPVAYLNSLGSFAIAINQGNFAARYKINANYDIVIKK